MAHDASGKFIGYGVDDISPECALVNHRLLAAYPGKSNAKTYGVLESTTFTQATKLALVDLVTFMNGDLPSRAAATTRGAKFPLRADGIADLNVRRAIGAAAPPAPPEPVCVMFSIGGAGSAWNQGYPYDIGETLDRSKCWHQPIGYNTAPFPMNKGVTDGIGEFIRQLDMPRGARGLNCTVLPWCGVFYSMGALVGMAVLDRILHGDLQRFKATYMGSSTFGNPRRQRDHAFPGCMNSSGEGISTPNDHDMPDAHWDFPASKDMPGAGGDDLYTKMADDENAQTTKNMRAVWDIVNKGNPLSLAEAVIMLLAHPSFAGGYAAAVAAFKALNFFVVKGTGPHVRYQFTLPLAGDGRDCWELARWHTADMVARLPRAYPALPTAA